MELQEFLSELKQAHNDFTEVKKTQSAIELNVIENEEMPLVLKFVEKIRSIEKKKVMIRGEEAVLLYVFDSEGKTLISPEVYITNNGDVAYEVFDESGYRRFRPTAIIQDGYNIIPLKEFLQHCPFYEIFSFYNDRSDVLYEQAEEIIENNKIRKAFVDKMKKFLD